MSVKQIAPAHHLGQNHEEDDGEAAAVEHHSQVQLLNLRPVLPRRHANERQVRRPGLASKGRNHNSAAGMGPVGQCWGANCPPRPLHTTQRVGCSNGGVTRA